MTTFRLGTLVPANALASAIPKPKLGGEIPVAMPTPKEQILFLLILSGQGQLHA
jgi:hypothetical protein